MSDFLHNIVRVQYLDIWLTGQAVLWFSLSMTAETHNKYHCGGGHCITYYHSNIQRAARSK